MKRRSLVSLAAVVAMVATSCSQPESQAFVDVPPIDDTIRTEAAFPDDGLSHFIVTPIADVDDVAGVDGAATTGAGDQSVDLSRFLTPEMVAGMPFGSSLEARDGVVGYVDETGQFVEIEGAPPAATPATTVPVPTDDEPVEVAMAYGNPYIDTLAADPAVASVTVIGDGSFGVSVSDPSVLDPRTFAIADDVPLGMTTDQYEPYQWALENDGTNLENVTTVAQSEDADIDITPTLERADGKGIVIAVVDSGVDFSHQDLANSAWSNVGEICGNGIDDDGNGYVDDCSGWDFGTNDASPYNQGADAHGTHVSGIITANRDGRGVAGVAPDARIMDLNVARRTPQGDSISGASVTAAIRYAVDNGADIINLSLGSQPGASAESVAPMAAAIDYAGANGVIVVVAAGNNGVDLASLPVYPASFNRSNMIVVGASGPTDSRAGFSNYNAGIVDVYAPGELILSTVPGDDFRFMSGTSQAAPATAAAVALIMQTNPDASMTDVIDAVSASVDQADGLSTSAASGRINVATAIGANGAPPIPTELDVRVSGVQQPSNEVTATIEITTPPDVFNEDYRWELSLVFTDDNGAYAVIDHPFLVDGDPVSTGENGALALGPADVTSVAVGTTLPAGRYSFIVEAVPTADPSFRLRDAFVTTFEIPGDPDTPVDTTPPTTAVPPSTTTPAGSDPVDETPDDTGVDSTTPNDDADDSRNDDDGSGDSAPGETSTGGSTPTTTSGATGSTPSAGGSSTTTPAETSTGGSNATVPTTGVPTTSAAGDGGSPTTTTVDTVEAPSTTTPGSAEPGADWTTPTPDGPPPTPSDIGTGEAKKGAWESTSVSPQAGYVNMANTVTIRGNFPSDTYVWFGGQPGQVVHQNRGQITVRTPLRAEPGLVDITLQKSPTGVVLTIPDAYAFVALDGSTGDPDGDAGSGGEQGDGTSTDGSTGDGASGGSDGTSGGDSSDDGSAEDDTTGGTETGDDTASSSDRRARMLVGSPLPLSNGLQGGSVTPNLAAGVPVCSTDPCSSTRR
jgi:hypothetical protein